MSEREKEKGKKGRLKSTHGEKLAFSPVGGSILASQFQERHRSNKSRRRRGEGRMEGKNAQGKNLYSDAQRGKRYTDK